MKRLNTSGWPRGLWRLGPAPSREAEPVVESGPRDGFVVTYWVEQGQVPQYSVNGGSGGFMLACGCSHSGRCAKHKAAPPAPPSPLPCLVIPPGTARHLTRADLGFEFITIHDGAKVTLDPDAACALPSPLEVPRGGHVYLRRRVTLRRDLPPLLSFEVVK